MQSASCSLVAERHHHSHTKNHSLIMANSKKKGKNAGLDVNSDSNLPGANLSPGVKRVPTTNAGESDVVMREADTQAESVSEIHSVVSLKETTGTAPSGKPRGTSKVENKRKRRKDDSPHAPKEKKKTRSEEKGEKGPVEEDPGRQFLSDLGKQNHPLPPAKAPAITSLTTGTNLRMSERDFQVLDAKRSSLYIAPPKTAKKARIKEADFDAAIDWVQKIVGKLTSVRVLPAYFVVTLQDERSRDQAFAVLRERQTEFTMPSLIEKGFNGLQVKPFGKDSRKSKRDFCLLFVQLGFDTEPEALREGFLVAWKDAHNAPVPSFEIRRVLRVGVPTEEWGVKVVEGEGIKGWTTKRVKIRDADGGGQERYFSQEGASRCRFCGEEGHSAWDCLREGTSKTFGPVILVYTPT
jgi:hypothetical protein